MEGHFTYFTPFVSEPNTQKFLTALGLGAIFCLLGFLLTKRLRNKSGMQDAIIPPEKVSTFSFFDFVTEKFVGFHDQVAGRENRKHVPFTLSVFLFVLFLNLLGLIPGMPAGTTTVWINVALAITVFIYFNWQGVKAHGLGGYLKHFCGPIIYIAPIVLIIELVSVCMRILTLNLRLYWNISADHIILGVFADMTKFFAFPFYFLGLFVAFIQAFVFVTLTLVYIVLASQHEEHHDEHEHAH